jgi:hypothetical protein
VISDARIRRLAGGTSLGVTLAGPSEPECCASGHDYGERRRARGEPRERLR